MKWSATLGFELDAGGEVASASRCFGRLESPEFRGCLRMRVKARGRCLFRCQFGVRAVFFCVFFLRGFGTHSCSHFETTIFYDLVLNVLWQAHASRRSQIMWQRGCWLKSKDLKESREQAGRVCCLHRISALPPPCPHSRIYESTPLRTPAWPLPRPGRSRPPSTGNHPFNPSPISGKLPGQVPWPPGSLPWCWLHLQRRHWAGSGADGPRVETPRLRVKYGQWFWACGLHLRLQRANVYSSLHINWKMLWSMLGS